MNNCRDGNREKKEMSVLTFLSTICVFQPKADLVGESRSRLPIFPLKSALVQAVKDNPSLILLGETGSGRRGDIFACWSKPSRTTPASFCWEKLDQVIQREG